MRKISLVQIAVFLFLLTLILGLGIGTTWLIFGRLPLADFRGVALTAIAVVLIYLYAFAVYRLFLYAMPLKDGVIKEGSREEFSYHVYLIFFLVLFYPVMRGGFVPVPLMRLIYIALGARLGDNTYSSGIILDPIFVKVGANTLIGQYALIIPHVIENRVLAHYPVRIGDNVTIGAHAVVMSDVEIGDNALVATGAVVKKGTTIGASEVWAGVPAQRIS